MKDSLVDNPDEVEHTSFLICTVSKIESLESACDLPSSRTWYKRSAGRGGTRECLRCLTWSLAVAMPRTFFASPLQSRSRLASMTPHQQVHPLDHEEHSDGVVPIGILMACHRIVLV